MTRRGLAVPLACLALGATLRAGDPDLSVTPIARDGQVLVTLDLREGLLRRVEDARPTEDAEAVRRWMTHFEHVPLSQTSALDVNAEYYVNVRVYTHPHNSWFFLPWDRTSVLGHAKFTFIP